MHHRVASPLAVILSTVAALAAVACRAAPEAPGSLDSDVKGTVPPAKADKGKSSGSSGSSGSTTPTPTPITPDPTAGTCSAKADGQACFDCCVAKGDVKAHDAVEEIYFSCVCAATACATQCAASVCGDTQAAPTAECDACLKTNDAACFKKADAACEASAGCKGISACGKSECSKFDESP